MDERLKQALEHSNYVQAIATKKQELKDRLDNTLLISRDGGTFTINQTLITFVHTLMTLNQETAILIDDRGNPVEIQSLAVFQEDILSLYIQATNDYLIQYRKLKNARTVEAVWV